MARETQSKKRTREQEAQTKSPAMPPSGVDATEAVEIDDSQDQNINLSSDIEGILAALQQVRQKAVSDGQKRTEEILNSVAGEITALVEETKKKVEKERQTLVNTASKACKEVSYDTKDFNAIQQPAISLFVTYEKVIKIEADNYKKAYETFSNAKDLHLQAYDDIFSKFEDTKENLLIKCDQQRKKEKAVIVDLQKICAEKTAVAEQSIKKKKQDGKSLYLLRKSLGTIFDSDGSNEDVDE